MCNTVYIYIYSAISEAKSSFGDSRLLLERYFENSHHVEVCIRYALLYMTTIHKLVFILMLTLGIICMEYYLLFNCLDANYG